MFKTLKTQEDKDPEEYFLSPRVFFHKDSRDLKDFH